MKRRILFHVTAVAALLLGATLSRAQVHHVHHHHHHHRTNYIAFQARPSPRLSGILVKKVEARIDIRGQVAKTSLDVHLENPSGVRQEGSLLIPVPAGASCTGLDFLGSSAEPTAKVLPASEAVSWYRSLVARVKDPALLEFAGYNLIRSSVFPIEPGGRQVLRVAWEHLLTPEDGRTDYVLPRSESVDYRIPWSVEVRIRGAGKLAAVYSPSHRVLVERRGDRKAMIELDPSASTVPGPVRLTWLQEAGDVAASILAYPDPAKKGGYFLMVAGLAPGAASKERSVKREVTLVIDRSGSMRDGKLDQVKAAASRIIRGLEPEERFNLLVYHQEVEAFSSGPVKRSPENLRRALVWLAAVEPSGGTNIYDALVEALRPPPGKDCLPIVLFLTDGLPTVGRTREDQLSALATSGNPYKRRIFTFGVGNDVNSPLLETLAMESRGRPTFVLPGENIDRKISRVFRSLSGPALAELELEVMDGRGRRVTPGALLDLMPARLPDLFAGEPLVLTGRYLGTGKRVMHVKARRAGKAVSYKISFDPARASTRNSFVPRLWASRRIAGLISEIRRLGAGPGHHRRASLRSPRVRELVDEVVRLSMEFGILTEYTAFLAREGSNLSDAGVSRRSMDNIINRAIRVRTGKGSVNQSVNLTNQRQQRVLNPRNNFFDENMNPVEVSNVQQVGVRTYWKRGGTWVDSRITGKRRRKPDRVVRFGTPAWDRTVKRLVRENQSGVLMMEGPVRTQIGGEDVLIESP